MVNERLVIWGATGHAKVLREALLGTGVEVAVLVDNRRVVSPLPGVQVLDGEEDLIRWIASATGSEEMRFAIAVGGARGRDRMRLFRLLLSHRLRPHTIIHRTAFVADDALLGVGCQVLANTAVCVSTRLGDGVIVNTAASVDHDCRIGAFAHIGPGARLAGEITVGERAFVGTGAVVLPRVRIGHDAQVGAGAVVTRDVPDGAVVVGCPARPIRDQPSTT